MPLLDLFRTPEPPPEPETRAITWDQAAAAGLIANPTQAGVVVTQDVALGISAVNCAVTTIAEAVAQLPLFVYSTAPNGGRTKLYDHPLWALLHDSANPEMTAQTFREAVTADALLWGDGYATIVRDRGGVPVELYPASPSSVRPIRDRSGRLVSYGVMGVDGEVEVPIQDVLRIKGPAVGTGGEAGAELIRLARQSWGLSVATERAGASFFKNGMRPSGHAEHPGRMSDKAHANLMASIRAASGADNTGRPFVLEEGTKWVRDTIAPNEAQHLETRQFQVIEVCRWFRIAPAFLFDFTRNTFSNSEVQFLHFATYTLLPWLRRWESEINRRLFTPGEGVHAEFMVDALARADSLTRKEVFNTQILNGTRTRNEVRLLENLEPLPGLDRPLIPVNMAQVDEQGEVVPFPTQEPAEPKVSEQVSENFSEEVSEDVSQSEEVDDG